MVISHGVRVALRDLAFTAVKCVTHRQEWRRPPFYTLVAKIVNRNFCKEFFISLSYYNVNKFIIIFVSTIKVDGTLHIDNVALTI